MRHTSTSNQKAEPSKLNHKNQVLIYWCENPCFSDHGTYMLSTYTVDFFEYYY